MKHNRGNLILTFVPSLIFASVAAVGWYYYYSEVDKNQIFRADSIEVQQELNSKLKKQQARIETINAEKLAIETSLQQEMNRVRSATAELKAELAQRQAELQSLHDQIGTVSGEKAQLLTQLEQEQKSKAHFTSLKNRLEQELIESRVELVQRQVEQQSLHDAISTASGEKVRLLSQLELEQKSKEQFVSLKNRLEKELNESRVEILLLKNQMTVIKLTDEVLFNSGSAELKPTGEKVLSLIAESLNSYPDRAISVEGHTDNVPILHKDRYESNWELSAARALAAVNYFQQNNQVDPKRLKVVGYGQYRPISSNETAEGRKINRRIEIKLLPPG
ncbi:MAG: OmpA family protein [Proteobacteria bacterium]|nr:OmpA family protein [Pseudomonadota bacterium]